MNFKDIGARIRARRKKLELTQEKLAEKTGLTDTYIGAIERATSTCSIQTLVKIAEALNLSMDFLLFGTTVKNIDLRFSELVNDIPKEKQKLFIELCEAIVEKLKK